MACTSPTSCIAVGSYRTDPRALFTTLLAERWDGTSWTVQNPPTPTGTTESGLSGVSCVSSSDCTAVGRVTVNLATYELLVEHWDGTAWAIESAPNVSGDTFLAVSCSSASACMAVGNGGLAERWDGTVWTLLTVPALPGDSPADLQGVSCVSATDCTAVGEASGNTLIERWDGSAWTVENGYSRQSGQLAGVSCTSRSACVAVGYQFLPSSRTIVLVERWNGTKWTTQTVQLPLGTTQDQSLNGVSCLPALPCTAVGRYTTQNAAYALIERSSSQGRPRPGRLAVSSRVSSAN